MLRWLVAAYCFAMLCVTLDIFFNLPIQRIFLRNSWDGPAFLFTADRGCFVGTLLLWPVLAYVWQQNWRGAAVGIWLWLGALVLFSDTAAGRLSFIVSTLVACAAMISPRMVRILLAVGVIGGMGVALPVAQIAQSYTRDHHIRLKVSFEHRLEIWEFTAKRILEKPVFGWGFNSSRAIPNMGQIPQHLGPLESIIPMHPHNWFLQILLEMGMMGALLVGSLFLWWLVQTAQLSRTLQSASMGSYSVVMVIAAVSIGMWQQWWWCAILLTAMVIAIQKKQTP